MDAFSLAIAYGTNKIKKNKIITLSILVGLFHYFMPYLGSLIGSHLLFLLSKSNYIVAIIFFLLAYEMYRSKDEEHTGTLTNFFSLIVFAFTVSIDSFSVGLVLGLEKTSLTTVFLIFSIVSATFTYIGLSLGTYLSTKYGKKSTYIGIGILILIGLKYIIN